VDKIRRRGSSCRDYVLVIMTVYMGPAVKDMRLAEVRSGSVANEAAANKKSDFSGN
jgi:hypothetical protein